MAVWAGFEEQISKNSLAVRPFRANAFRILSIAADADSSRIDRQAGRLLVAIQFDPAAGEGACGLKDLTALEVSEAVNLLDDPDTRVLEELFWLHAVTYDLQPGPAEVLRAARMDSENPITHHNLAVLLTIYALEVDPHSWDEALTEWKHVLDEPLVGEFFKARAAHLGATSSSQQKLAAAVVQRLVETLQGQVTQAAKMKDVKLMALLVRALEPHRDWLDLEASLRSAADPLIKEGFVSLGAIHDELAELRPDEDKSRLSKRLAAIVEKLGAVAAGYADLRSSLGEVDSEPDWEKALCSTYQRLMLVFFHLLGDLEGSQRVMQQAERLVSNLAFLEPLQREWQQLLASGLLREAEALLRAGNYNATDSKLDEAWASASVQQRSQIEILREACGFARAAAEKRRRLEQLQREQQASLASELDEGSSGSPSLLFRPQALWILVALGLAGALGTAIFAGGTRQLPVPVVPPARGPAMTPAKDQPSEQRTVLASLEQSLAARRKELETAGLELDKQRRSLEAVTAAYQGQVLPPNAQQIYQQLLTDYNNRVLQHNKSLAQWQKDDADYRAHLSTLHTHEEVAKR